MCGLLTVAVWGLSYSSEPSAEPPLGAKLALRWGQEKRVGHTYHHHLSVLNCASYTQGP